MTPEKQRIAIAEACGWWISESLSIWQHKTKDGAPPDYLNDLNAMHEAEKLLQWTDQDIKYTNYLFDAVGINRFYYTGATPEAFPADRQFAVFHANATQRAKAFLRTIDKWEESK